MVGTQTNDFISAAARLCRCVACLDEDCHFTVSESRTTCQFSQPQFSQARLNIPNKCKALSSKKTTSENTEETLEVRSVIRLQNCPTCRNTATCPEKGRCGRSAVGTRRGVRNKIDVGEVRLVMRLQSCPTCRNTATCPEQDRCGGSAVGNEVAKLPYLQEHGEVSGTR
ncbi:hypothetical protein J6590_018996 [Homalodisca vitripennis]|nr:hypothetical protein J6590_018996 [Homalodisca vitripennis]